MGGRRRAALAIAVVGAIAVPLVLIPWSSPDDRPDVVISEVMTANRSTLFDPDGESPDWIELWNRSPTSVDLTGWQLSDDDNGVVDEAGWSIPQLSLAPGDRMVIFASGKADRHRLHAAFRLSADGEYVGLQDPSNRTVAEFRVPALGSDISYGLGSDGQVGVLAAPTPGLPNTPVKPPAAAKPVLSRAGGYIDVAVSIAATTETENAQLWYTTDGSTPTNGHGTQYNGPIHVDSTTTLRMVAAREGFSDSLVASATYLVMDDVLAQAGIPFGWNTAGVNGQIYQFGFDQNYINRFGQQVASALKAAPTLSITTDLENLIGADTGIYDSPWLSGSEWERPASVELIDSGSGFQINGGIRLKGGISRNPTNSKHSFRLSFGLQYETSLTYPLFGATGIQSFASVDLRAEQNTGWQHGSPQNTMLRDQFVRETQAAVGDPSTRSRWVHLFLNGQYWGLYMLREDITSDHAAAQWGGTSADYDVVTHSNDLDFDIGRHDPSEWVAMWSAHVNTLGYEVKGPGNDEEWAQLWTAIEDVAVTDAEFDLLAQNVDLNNLADFMLINVVVGNTDSAPATRTRQLANNWQAVRGNGQPFRFFLDDCEITMGVPKHRLDVDRTESFPVGDDNEYWDLAHFNPAWLHQVLLTRAEYRAIVRDRASTLLGSDGALRSSANLARWNALRAQIDPLIEAEVARWGFAGTQELGRPEWEAEVDWVANVWFPNRDAIVLGQLRTAQLLKSSSTQS